MKVDPDGSCQVFGHCQGLSLTLPPGDWAGTYKTRMNVEKNERWSDILRDMSATYRCCPVVMEEIKFIKSNDSSLADILCNLPSELGYDKEKFFNLYFDMSQNIPDEWFIEIFSEDCSISFHELPILADLTMEAKKKIWMDVPRTYLAFSCGDYCDSRCAELLSNDDKHKMAKMLAALCRVLTTSSTFLEGGYCQGMSFLAASYILYCRVVLSSSKEESAFDVHAAAAFIFIALRKYGLADLYVEPNSLSEYIVEFEFQLSAPYSPKIKSTQYCARNAEIHQKLSSLYSHLSFYGLNAHYFVVQWFGSCFSLGVSSRMLFALQEIFLYGSGSCHLNNVMIRMGVAVLYVLADKLMKLMSFESLYLCLQDNMVLLNPADVVPVMFIFDMKRRNSMHDQTQSDCGCAIS